MASKNESRSLLPSYNGDNSTVNLLFPVGDKYDDYRNQLTVVVTNDAEYSADLRIYPINVRSLTIIIARTQPFSSRKYMSKKQVYKRRRL